MTLPFKHSKPKLINHFLPKKNTDEYPFEQLQLPEGNNTQHADPSIN